MITVKCDTRDHVRLQDMVPFQGTLKKRLQKDIDALKESILTDGLLSPFLLWHNKVEQKLYILDGHGRREALRHAALDDMSILEQELPCVIIDAETEEEARKILLQIVSVYGRIDTNGVIQFVGGIVDYKAPVLVKVNRVINRQTAEEATTVLVKLRVRKDIVDKLKVTLKDVDGVEVL